MNLELLESFGQNYPEENDGVLDCVSMALTAGFNRKGTLLSVGCNDGRVVIWDFLTRGIAKVVAAHVHPVCSICWSRNGQKILSASTDNTICILDVLTGDCEHRFRFPSAVLKAQYDPRNSNIFLVCPMRYPPLICTIEGGMREVPIGEDDDLCMVASFDRRGQHVYTGNSKGKLMIYRCSDLELVASFRIGQSITSTTAIKSIEFSRRGDWFLLNSADRIIRVYNASEVISMGVDCDPEPIQKLQDLVNKTMWKKCCFSGDGDYVCAGSSRQHALYIWEKSIGNLVKILHGTKGELLLDVVWHPMRPIVASISSGVVSIWSQNQVENWSAFAPDFKELDENVEYEERESEFDIEDEDKMVDADALAREDDLEVDVTGVAPVRAYLSSDEEGDDPNQLLFLPIAPEVEEGEETWAPPLDTLNEESSRKRYHSSEHKENSPHKRRKPKIHDMQLPNAPTDEVHPLLSNRPNKEKSKKSSHSSSRPRSESKKHKDRPKS